MANLTTVAAVKAYANVAGTDDDGSIGGIIAGVSEILAGRVGHDYDGASHTEKHSGASSGFIILSRPAATVTSVIEDGDTLDASDYELSDERRLARLGSGLVQSWASGLRNVTVTFAPVSLVPADLELAAREISAFVLKQSALDGGTSRLGLSSQANADTGSAEYFAQAIDALPVAKATIRRYRKMF